MADKKLDIKKPCSQKWDEMTPLGDARYCNSCNHIIHDFSNMSNQELLQMLQSGKYSCGMFDQKQMGMIYQVQQVQQASKKYWNAIAAAIVAGMLQVSTGYSQTPGQSNILMPKSQSILRVGTENRVNTEQLIPTTEKATVNAVNADTAKSTVTQKSKFSFRLVDADTKKPLQYVKVEVMGFSGFTDSLGRIDFELEYNTENGSRVFIQSALHEYEDQTTETHLEICLNKLTVIYLRKKKKEERYMILGQWG